MNPAAHHELIELANARMPYGKYKGKLLLEIPEAYLVWYQGKGFPDSKIGTQLAQMLMIKSNGLQGLLYKLVSQ